MIRYHDGQRLEFESNLCGTLAADEQHAAKEVVGHTRAGGVGVGGVGGGSEQRAVLDDLPPAVAAQRPAKALLHRLEDVVKRGAGHALCGRHEALVEHVLARVAARVQLARATRLIGARAVPQPVHPRRALKHVAVIAEARVC